MGESVARLVAGRFGEEVFQLPFEAQIDAIARNHLADIRGKVRELNRIARELDRTINACSGGARGQCSILATLREPMPASRVKTTDVRRKRSA